MSTKTSDYKYDLPEELIAQTPLANRDGSRLLVLDRRTGAVEHNMFANLPKLLRPNDCLVRNTSKVLPARLLGQMEGGGACELLLLNDKSLDGVLRWECLARPGKKLQPGKRVVFGNGQLTAEIEGFGVDGTRLARFECATPFYETLDALGQMPLPPYIKERLEDNDRYQTVYAKESGSAAAPTAGLHFTERLLQEIADNGVTIADVTLHVGLGTFRPVKADDVSDHIMHSEHAILPQETVTAIQTCRQKGGRIIAVGTTVCRLLESFAAEGELKAGEMDTQLFIHPGYQFKVLDGLITNFHLPESTLLMLVSAFSSREYILNAYKQAVDEKYRFFSFGDAMLMI
ncbi:MAG: tRNA preQ1(34) S-adenosylmethionine ribosyltransferase-isomerase QueA [Oscillospiraceae bacterium]|nr:tRNA preQ1(34) S-adenosylmethionine ribosyltransferase-isomerase QueA [Oscillospiraceae bacterium]